MKFFLISLFPEFFDSSWGVGVLGRAFREGLVQIETINPRDFTKDPHRTTDDYAFGGGAGMVMKPGPLVAAVARAKDACPAARVLALSPGGEPFTDRLARDLAGLEALVLVCGRYEGIDQRFIDAHCDGELSVGDFVLTGGEAAALCVVDAVARQIPGVVGNEENIRTESFRAGLKYPVYTRPRVFQRRGVPPVLLSGDRKRIEDWRRAEALRRTAAMRPDKVIQAGRHKMMLELVDWPLSPAITLAKAAVPDAFSGAILISASARVRKGFREFLPGDTLSCPTKLAAAEKIKKRIGSYERLPVDEGPLSVISLRQKAMALLSRGEGVALSFQPAFAEKTKNDPAWIKTFLADFLHARPQLI